MKYIKEITIKYFRSIYNIKLKELNDCVIFSGKNDVGKSNLLKALNLFFNNQTDWQTDFNFYNDFNFTRLTEVRDESIKGKQFIQIEIKFRKGTGFKNTLPNEFLVKRTWDRYSSIPKETDNLESLLKKGKIPNTNLNIIKRSLTQFLNKVKFEYVPAIKDQRLFNHLLNELQNEIFSQLSNKGENISDEIRQISQKFSDSIIALKNEFQKSTNIHSEISLPIEPNELFRVLNVVTDGGQNDNNKININFRGDGIRLRYIPSLYNFLAENHRGLFILGFEEPENSMEYGLSSNMAKDFFNKYSKYSQIFITSHSPAFLVSNSSNVDLFRIFQDDNQTKQAKLLNKDNILSLNTGDLDNTYLKEELGLSILQQEFHKQYESKLLEQDENLKKIEELNAQLENINKPILYTEGITDVSILQIAWEKLFPDTEIPFEVLPIQTTSESGGDGGFTALNKKLESVKQEEKLQIGLYDRDISGYKKGFLKLNKNFKSYNDYEFIKYHKNKKSFAIVIPSQSGLEDFIKHNNLPIEFLFSEEDINRKNQSGQGLVIIPFQRKIEFGGETVEEVTINELYLASIDSNSKKVFADEIVPSFEISSFERFSIIFEKISEIINEYNN